MPDDTILCWTWPAEIQGLLPAPDPDRHVTVKDCKAWLSEGDTGRYKLAAFIRQRLRERYIEPVLCLEPEEKNGFSIMAVSCLLIETLETFRQGWPSSDGKSALAFCYFLDREARFSDFRGHFRAFYKHVRCGILHQGETTGGWKITRKVGEPLFDMRTHTVHATKFHDLLADVIDSYRDELKAQPLTSETCWKNFNRKLKATMENCEP